MHSYLKINESSPYNKIKLLTPAGEKIDFQDEITTDEEGVVKFKFNVTDLNGDYNNLVLKVPHVGVINDEKQQIIFPIPSTNEIIENYKTIEFANAFIDVLKIEKSVHNNNKHLLIVEYKINNKHDNISLEYFTCKNVNPSKSFGYSNSILENKRKLEFFINEENINDKTLALDLIDPFYVIKDDYEIKLKVD